MTIIDAYAVTKKHNVMQDTWGHLYPEPGSKHEGVIIVASGANGDVTILDDIFPTLECSPMRAEVVGQVLDMGFTEKTGVYEIHCTLWFYKNCNDMYLGKPVGRVIKPKIQCLYDLSSYEQDSVRAQTTQ